MGVKNKGCLSRHGLQIINDFRNSVQRGVASVNIVTTRFNPFINYEIVNRKP